MGPAAKRSRSLKLQEEKGGWCLVFAGLGSGGAEPNRAASGRDWRLSALTPSSLLRSVFSESGARQRVVVTSSFAFRPGDSIKRLDVGGQELTSCQTGAIADGAVVANTETK